MGGVIRRRLLMVKLDMGGGGFGIEKVKSWLRDGNC
jgi:hypothetical protein